MGSENPMTEIELLKDLVRRLADELAGRQWHFEDNPRECNTCLSCGASYGSSAGGDPDGWLEHKPDCDLRKALDDAEKVTEEKYY